ncbi:MAG: PTS sugar transporter subunit IIA [Elusimicrobiota bacterium]|jgi:PTS system nitrogen regulatory IIA component|nr:PTS sugar transporter subunit IIA [Elusimicrobiota bacterium]
MRITDFLSKDAIVTDLKAEDKKSAITELVNVLKTTKKLKDAEKVVEVILEREKLGSTGIGQGVAIPHGKSDVLQNQVAALGISKKGIDFNSLDGESVYIVFLLTGPVEVAGLHLKALSRISRLFKDKYLRQAIRESATADEIAKIIENEDAY